MAISREQFNSEKNKRLTLLGMSGVGKTHLAKLLNKDGGWFHFSGDYRIGTAHLKDAIINNVSLKMKKDPWLKPLLENNSISINSQVTFDNLEPIAAFLGKVGNPEEGGLPIDEFVHRQSLFLAAEKNTMQEVPDFILRSQAEGYAHFINDAGGSLCELGDKKLYAMLADKTLIVYIKSSKKHEQALIDRAKSQPKPVYYHPVFFETAIKNYLKDNNLSYAAEVNPDAFVGWVFPRLIEDRLAKYQTIADEYGCTIKSDELHACSSAKEVISLIAKALK
ncbi:ATPase [Candidatus Thioglobus sp. NP1]|uniref:ATPase n=1 Tax=Candidatus Thioglobus sp. NP1 TaxID=2508687 RepID=UPI000DED7625|nr:ATPase [Candidatus Thioglobus sp. NP1]AXE61362.1 ATPase [Candidatus Thioglobus sp. NP1]